MVDFHFLSLLFVEGILINKYSVQFRGTPVIVFGNYNFIAPKPWLQLYANPHTNDITDNEIQVQTAPYLNNILEEQKRRTASGH